MTDRAVTLPSSERRPLVIGVGNRHRGDDAVGLEVAERVGKRLGELARVVPFEGESTGLLDLWEGAPLVVLIDALRSQGSPGRIHRFDGSLSGLLPEPAISSTHALSLGEVWRLGESLGMLPDRLVVFGVEAEEFSLGSGFSPEVARALDPLTDGIVLEILHAASGRTAPVPEVNARA